MEYTVIENNGTSKLIEIEINGAKHQTLIVGDENKTQEYVDSFAQTVTNPATFTTDTALEEQRQSGKTKLKNLGLTDEEILALTENKMDSKEQDRLTLVEVQVAKIETKLDMVANNHLKHLQDDITSVKKTQWWLFSTLLGCLLSLVILLVQSLV